MTTLGVRETMQQKLLQLASITQAYQFAKPGNAELGFVALQRLSHCGTASRRLEPPQETCAHLRQHAVRLEAGAKGRRTFDFLKGSETHAEITRHGYARQARS